MQQAKKPSRQGGWLETGVIGAVRLLTERLWAGRHYGRFYTQASNELWAPDGILDSSWPCPLMRGVRKPEFTQIGSCICARGNFFLTVGINTPDNPQMPGQAATQEVSGSAL